MGGLSSTVSEESLEQRKALGFYKDALAELGSRGERSRYRLREWKPVYTKILVLYQKGMTPTQIAAMGEIGFSIRQVQLILRDPLFRLKLSQYNKKMDVAIIEKATEEITRFPEVELARDKLLMSSEQAADLLLKLMRPRGNLAKTPLAERKVMIEVCKDILDRAGLQKLSVAQEDKQRREYSPDEIKSALDNAKELEAISNRLSGNNSQFVLGSLGEAPSDIETTEGIDPTAPIEPPFHSTKNPQETVGDDNPV